MDPRRRIKLSKRLAYVLRHGAPSLGLALRADGFALVDDLLKIKGFEHVSLQDLREICETDQKRRYSCVCEDDGSFMIRANQGHSLNAVDEKQLFSRKIASADELREAKIVHGTFVRHLESIRRNGLCAQSRTHVHFARGVDAKAGVRANAEVWLVLNVEEALNAGNKIFVSENDVVMVSSPVAFEHLSIEAPNKKRAAPG